jgi:hypothetical protein
MIWEWKSPSTVLTIVWTPEGNENRVIQYSWSPLLTRECSPVLHDLRWRGYYPAGTLTSRVWVAKMLHRQNVDSLRARDSTVWHSFRNSLQTNKIHSFLGERPRCLLLNYMFRPCLPVIQETDNGPYRPKRRRLILYTVRGFFLKTM